MHGSHRRIRPVRLIVGIFAVVALLVIIAVNAVACSGVLRGNDSKHISYGLSSGLDADGSNALVGFVQSKLAGLPMANCYKPGVYKVGTDLPAGEYVIIVDSSGPAYLAISTDLTGSISSIVGNDNFMNRSIVTVRDGEYLEFTKGSLFDFMNAPKLSCAGSLPEGMYKVGVDLPAGEYRLQTDSLNGGYYAVYSNSRHSLWDIVCNECFNGEVYITLADGQYVELSRVELVVE